MKVVSACLAGINCRYDGKSIPCQKVINLVKQGKAVPVCPEQLGGLSTPRDSAEQKDGKVITKNGEDVSDEFIRGAEEALKIVQIERCDEAILKSKSPSCGCGKVYDGSFSGRLINGDGVFTKILKENGVRVLTEEDL